jgi:hypothetical protein
VETGIGYRGDLLAETIDPEDAKMPPLDSIKNKGNYFEVKQLCVNCLRLLKN